MRVQFDSVEDCLDKSVRTDPYLMISACFEFGRKLSIEFHDGRDFGGGTAIATELWRSRFCAVIRRGVAFDIALEVSEEAFAEIRTYLTLILSGGSFRDDCVADYGPASPLLLPPDDGLD